MADMIALTFDRSRERWSESTGLVKESVPVPTLLPDERDSVVIKVHLLVKDGFSEQRSLPCVIDGVLNDKFQPFEHICGAPKAFFLELRHLHHKPHVLTPNAITLRHSDIIKEDLSGV